MQLYIAEVIKNTGDLDENGSEQKIGRVQIYIASLHHGIDTTLLPWASPASCLTSSIPKVGKYYWVFLEPIPIKEDLKKNFFYLSPVQFKNSNNQNETIGSLESEYPDVKYWKTEAGVSIAITDGSKPEVSIKHPKAEIYIDKDGNIKINATNGDNIITANSSGINIKDKNSNEIKMESGGITIKTGDATAWKPCIIDTCIFSGAAHGGSNGGITKLKGA